MKIVWGFFISKYVFQFQKHPNPLQFRWKRADYGAFARFFGKFQNVGSAPS